MKKFALLLIVLLTLTTFADTYFDIGNYIVTGKVQKKNNIYQTEVVLDQNKKQDINDFRGVLDELPFLTYTSGSKSYGYRLDGFNDYQFSITLDGATIYNVYDSYIDLNEIPVNNIAKVEINRGVNALLSGPEAFGASINLVTEKPKYTERKLLHLRLSENNSRLYQFSYEGNNNDLAYHLNFFKDTTDGYSLSRDFVPNPDEDGGVRDNSDFDKESLNLYIGKKFKNDEHGIRYTKIDNTNGLVGDTEGFRAGRRFWRFTTWEKEQFSYNLIEKNENKRIEYTIFKDTYYNVLDAYDNANYNTQLTGRAFHSIYDDDSLGIKVVPEYKMKNYDLSMILYYKDDEHKEQDDIGDPWEKYSAKVSSFGAVFDFRNKIKAGLSYSTKKLGNIVNNTAVLTNYVFNANLVGTPGEKPVLDDLKNTDFSLEYAFDATTSLDISQKNRFPTIKEMYSGYLGTDWQNPDLDSEKATIIGLNYIGNFGQVKYSSRVFLNNVKDQIDNVVVGFYDDESGVNPTDNDGIQNNGEDDVEQNQNIGEFDYTGLAFDMNYQYKNNIFRLLLSYNSAKNKTNPATDKVENFAEQKLVFDYSKQIGNNKIRSKITYVGDSEQIDDFSGLWTKIPSYTLVDIYYDHDLFEGKTNRKFYVNVKNAFDRNYYTYIGRPEAGRSVEIGQQISF